MTPEAQRIALADWAGWLNLHKSGSLDGQILGYPPSGLMKYQEPPDYLSDLNAVHELEKRLSEHQQSEYIKFMIWNRIGPDNENLIIYEAFTATATERCETLCRVLWPQKWK